RRFAEAVPHLADVDQVAVVAQRDRAPPAVLDERLRVRPLRRAGRRVAVMADRDLAAEATKLLLVEDLGDETEVAQRREAPVLGDRDSGRLLASMLESEKAEVREPRNVAVGRVDPEDAAHVLTDLPNPHESALAEASDLARPAGEDRGAASRVVVVRELDVRLEPSRPGRGR